MTTGVSTERQTETFVGDENNQYIKKGRQCEHTHTLTTNIYSHNGK